HQPLNLNNQDQPLTGQTRFTSNGVPFPLCVECVSLGWLKDTIGIDRPKSLNDVVAAHLGVGGNPWSGRVWAKVIEPSADVER
ncbi:hypothetical protein, partial [Streptomyces sp. PT12]|uniref:hypothetical protein n=1 Tax=Streptomyces sp. PT12 TaxID=1510197 RepID=UPI0015EFCA65